MQLTKRQDEILSAITSFMAENKYAPTSREIGEMVGLKSVSTIHKHLENLKEKGVIDWKESKPRTLKVCLEVNYERNATAMFSIR